MLPPKPEANPGHKGGVGDVDEGKEEGGDGQKCGGPATPNHGGIERGTTSCWAAEQAASGLPRAPPLL